MARMWQVQRIYDTFHEPFRKTLQPPSSRTAAGPSKFVHATGSQSLNAASQQAVLDTTNVISDVEDSDEDGLEEDE